MFSGRFVRWLQKLFVFILKRNIYRSKYPKPVLYSLDKKNTARHKLNILSSRCQISVQWITEWEAIWFESPKSRKLRAWDQDSVESTDKTNISHEQCKDVGLIPPFGLCRKHHQAHLTPWSKTNGQRGKPNSKRVTRVMRKHCLVLHGRGYWAFLHQFVHVQDVLRQSYLRMTVVLACMS